jgi:hypothetical protein
MANGKNLELTHTGDKVTGAEVKDANGKILASLDMTKGSGTAAYEGGRLAYTDVGGVKSLTATDGNNKSQLSIGPDGKTSMSINGEHVGTPSNLNDKPTMNDIALGSNAGTMYLSQDGGQLFVPNGHGGYDTVHAGAGTGDYKMGNGETLHFSSDASGASNISLSGANGKQLEQFAVAREGEGNAQIGHTDAQGNMDRISFSTNGTTAEYNHMGANGEVLQRDTVSADNGMSRYYDPSNPNQLVGTEKWQENANGTLSTSYRDGNGELRATVVHEPLPNGGRRQRCSWQYHEFAA